MRLLVFIAIVFLSRPCMSQEITFSYMNKSLTPAYQSGGYQVLPVGHNPARAGFHEFGTPSNHFPWLHPGGTSDGADETQFWSIKELTLPSPIVVRKINLEVDEKYHTDTRGYDWSYPVGTVAKLRFFDKELGEFSHHISTKTREGTTINSWEGEEILLTNRVPVWYNSPNNCTDCHRDVGVHASILKPKEKDYYHWNRGRDGRFSWHPFADVNPKGRVSQHADIRLGREILFKK